MPCPVCYLEPGSGADHRFCLVELFRSGKIQSIAEWSELSRAKPKTYVKRRVIVKIKKEEE
jgi:hypothetical protein